MEAILDSSFIVSCVRRKIDFLEEIENLGFKVKVPKKVFQEMKDLKKKEKTSRADREAIELAFKILDDKRVKKVNIGGKNVDEGLILKGQEGSYIATLDRGIKNKVNNKIIINNASNSVIVERS